MADKEKIKRIFESKHKFPINTITIFQVDSWPSSRFQLLRCYSQAVDRIIDQLSFTISPWFDTLPLQERKFNILLPTPVQRPIPTMANFLPVEDAVKQSKYSAGHIRYLIRRNLVQGKKISVLWLVDLDSLKEYERKMEEAGTAKFRPKSLDSEE